MDRKRRIDKKKNSYKAAMTSISVILLAVFIVSFGIGHFTVPVTDVIKILIRSLSDNLAGLFGGQGPHLFDVSWTDQMYLVVTGIRLPRIITACLVGGALSIAGAGFQGVFSNPMAAPDILGASSGAGFGASLAILLGLGMFETMLLAFGLGIATVLIVFLIASKAHGQRTVNLILAGVMISSLFSSGISLIKLVADPADKLPKITYWLMGSLGNTGFKELKFVIIPMLMGIVPIFLLRWRINILTLDEKEALSLGINVKAIRTIIILCATLATSACVCISGMIGWVGLVIPHFARKLVGDDYRKLIPMTLIMGSTFLLIVDDISRSLLLTEIPIGILTAFIGAPFFMYLLVGKKSS